MLNLEPAKKHKPLITNHTQRETEIYEVRQNAYVPGAEERSINDLHKIYKRITMILSRTHSARLLSKMGSTPLFIERRKKKPKIATGQFQNAAQIRLSVNHAIGHSKCGQPPDRLRRPLNTLLMPELCRSTGI